MSSGPPGAPVTAAVVMWEARAVAGRGAELVGWLLDWVAGRPDVTVYASRAADRVVVVSPAGRMLPAPPAELLARPAQGWSFQRLQPPAGRPSC